MHKNQVTKPFLVVQKYHSEISGMILGIENGEKHPLGQNCPKKDATVKNNVVTLPIGDGIFSGSSSIPSPWFDFVF